MKKLIAIAALAACLPAFSGQVASSNTVGYQKLTLGAGFNWVAPQFLNVGGQGINIQAIQLDFGGEEVTGGDNIQILDEGGATLTTYNWFPSEWIEGSDTDGWIDETGELANVTIEAGQSILLDCVNAGTVVKVFGEVSAADYETTAVAGFNFVGNTTPVTINVQQIQLDFGGEEVTGGDNIQILDEGGATLATYNWFPSEWIEGSNTDGWIDETGELANFNLTPGQGILIDAVSDGTVISVPAAL